MTTSCEESWPSVIRSQIKTEKKKKQEKKESKREKRKRKKEKEKKENTWKTSSKNRSLFSNT